MIKDYGTLPSVTLRCSAASANLGRTKIFSARKKLEALRTFFKFVHESGWLPTNPAKVIKPPKVNDPPTLPYPQDVLPRVLTACDKYPDKQYAVRLRALILLLRYCGLRITDA